MVWCTSGCGECFCSASCAETSAPAHNLLCAGPIPEGEPEHPLLKFKLHALRCNEAFLLAAEVVATLLSEAGAQGAAATRRAADRWIRHFQPDGPELWWNVAQQPEAMIAAGVMQLTFRDSCRAHVTTSALLLGQALHDRAPTLAVAAAPLLEVDGFYGQLLGLFELYSMGVRVPSAIGSLCEEVRATGADEQKRSLAGQLDEYVAGLESAEDSDSSCCEGEADEYKKQNEEKHGEKHENEQSDDEMDQEVAEEKSAKRHKTAHSSTDAVDPQFSDACESEDELEQCEKFIAAAGSGELVEFPPLDATALYATVCKLNHSCNPNCEVTFEASSGAVAVLKVHIKPFDGTILTVTFGCRTYSERAGFAMVCVRRCGQSSPMKS